MLNAWLVLRSPLHPSEATPPSASALHGSSGRVPLGATPSPPGARTRGWLWCRCLPMATHAPDEIPQPWHPKLHS